jgi:hypothetical protein
MHRISAAISRARTRWFFSEIALSNREARSLRTASAIVEVISLSYNKEILTNYGSLVSQIKQSVILQEMVSKPKFSGTVFLRSKDDPESILVEALCNEYGEDLMSGMKNAELRLRFSHDLGKSRAEVFPENLNKEEIIKIFHTLCDQAIEIHWLTGCDDLEYCIDSSGKIWWLQARPLPSNNNPVRGEIESSIDLHEHFNNSLHYGTWEANLMRGLQIIIKDEGDNFSLNERVLWGTNGVVKKDNSHRELQFHIKVAVDKNFLDKVTRYGWKVEQAISNSLNKAPLGRLYALLMLHQGARAGSYGYRGSVENLLSRKP